MLAQQLRQRRVARDTRQVGTPEALNEVGHARARESSEARVAMRVRELLPRRPPARAQSNRVQLVEESDHASFYAPAHCLQPHVGGTQLRAAAYRSELEAREGERVQVRAAFLAHSGRLIGQPGEELFSQRVDRCEEIAGQRACWRVKLKRCLRRRAQHSGCGRRRALEPQ